MQSAIWQEEQKVAIAEFKVNKKEKMKMPKILINYKYNKKTDTYTLCKNDVVYADLPIAEIDMYDDIEEPLVVPIKNKMTVVEKSEYTKINKQFVIAVDKEGNIIEDQNGVAVWLPIDTDLSKLRFINGQLVMVSEDQDKEGE